MLYLSRHLPPRAAWNNLFFRPSEPSVPDVSCQRVRDPVPLTPTQEHLLGAWLEKHKAPVDPIRRQPPAGQETVSTPEPVPATPTQEVLLANWLRRQREPASLRRRTAPLEQNMGTAQEPPVQTQEPCQGMRKDSVHLRAWGRPASHKIYQNPKWNDDTWFEKRYGDPGYYTRVKGL